MSGEESRRCSATPIPPYGLLSARPSEELLEGAHKIGVRTLGIPEEFGGTPLDPKSEVQTFTAGAYAGPEK